MLANPMMEMSPSTSCFPPSQAHLKNAANKLSFVEKNDLFVSQFALEIPRKHMFLPVRAEEGHGRSRASSSLPETERRLKNTIRDDDELESMSVWDSNAEGIRGSWRQANKRPSLGSRSDEDSPDAYASNKDDNWQWWRSGPDDDDYEGDPDDDEEDSWFNLNNFDMLDAISLLRWMVPAAALILPWLLGGPMFLIMAFAFFPLGQKLLGAFIPRSWKAAFQGQNASSKQRGRRRSGFWNERKYGPYVESREESDFFDSQVEDWETSFLQKSVDWEASSKLGGWDEQKSEVVSPKKVRRGKKKTALERRRSRGEVPLFFRLLVALFPFLRSWGGFL